MATAVAVKYFFSRQTDLYRPIENQSSLGDNDFVIERVALSAEAAPVGRGNHANMRGRYFQHFGERAMEIVRCLGARPDCQLSIRILDRYGGMLLDGKVRIPLKEKNIFESLVSLGKAFFHVAELQSNELMDVPLFAVIVDARFGSCKSFFRVGDGG